MKRIISLCLFAVFLIGTLAVPVSASEADSSSYINVLEFATANDSGVNSFTSNGTYVATAVYDVAYGPYLRYADIVITSAGGDPTSVTLNGEELTLVKIAARLFRAYGSFVVTSGDMTLDVTSDTTGVRYNVVSFKAGMYSSMEYPETGFFAVGTHMENTSYIYMADSDSPAEYLWRYTGEGGNLEDFVSYIYLQDWTKYDYFDVVLNLNVTSLDSLTVMHGDSVLDYEVSYFEASGSDWYIRDYQEISNTGSDNAEYVKRRLMVTLRIDLSDADRDKTSYPCITLRGTYGQQDIGLAYEVELTSTTGHIVTEAPNSIAFWLMKIKVSMEIWSQKILDAINGDAGAVDEFQQQVDQQAGELESMGQIMDSVAKPAIDSFDVDINAYIDPSDVTVVAAPLGALMSGDIFGTMLIMSIMMAMVGFVLFGKR